MSDPAWLQRAKSLDKGKRCRWRCCGDGKGAIVSAGENGWSLFCFRDEEHNEFVRYPEPSLAERIARLTRQEAADAAAQGRVVPTLPQGTANPSEWPNEARVWLYKAGLSNSDISDLGCTWSEEMERVIIPLYRNGEVIYWQGRNVFDDRRPKYINPAVDRSKLLYENGVTSDVLVLTEDILSAYKIGLAGFMAWSLMGTKFNVYALRKIVDESTRARRRIVVWLDPDAAGQGASAVLRRTLRAYGVDAGNCVSRVDPKKHSRREIKELLCSCSSPKP